MELLNHNLQRNDEEGLNDDLLTGPNPHSSSSSNINTNTLSYSRQQHLCIEPFPGAAAVYYPGQTALDEFNDDRFATERKTNLYYPFANRNEWQSANWLLTSSLTMAEIDGYLKLEVTKNNQLSFRTSHELKARMDLLPPVARWKSKKLIVDPSYPTKKPVHLFYRDAIEVLQDILKSPLVQDYLSFTPLQIFETAAKLTKVYDSWLSGERAWRLQSELPQGHTLIGTILSSDKTMISVMTGNRCAHPLLISVANIDCEYLSKASHHLFQLLALLPIPTFRHKSQEIRGVLDNRMFHRCLDIVLRPLKVAAAVGVMMADPVGQVRCSKIDALATKADPQDIERYWPFAQKSRTNGVVDPCWRDWASSDPSEFLHPEILHHWHKFFFDHDLKWCINVIGAEEIDFRYSLVQKRQGFRVFPEGISRLKQVTGRDQREIQRYVVTVVAGATSNRFLLAIRALCDFRYAGQAPRFNDTTAVRVQRALDEFHEVKDEVLKLGGRLNSKGEPLENWEIPKLEFMQSVFPSIKASGPIIQWDANKTERAHITMVKLPARSGNGREYKIQICRELDLHSRMRHFDLMTSMKDANVDFRITNDSEGVDGGSKADVAPVPTATTVSSATVATTTDLIEHVVPVSAKMWGSTRSKKNLFTAAVNLLDDPNAPRPLRTFLGNRGHTAFHLIREPDLKTHTVQDAQTLFQLPDFSAALLDYLNRARSGTSVFAIAGRRMVNDVSTEFPFTIKIWSKLHVQGKQYHAIHLPNDTHTVFATPPNAEWKFGRNDCVLINIDDQRVWPQSSLEGHCVVMVKMIFAPTYGRNKNHHPRTDEFLAYCKRFDVVNQPPPPSQYANIPCYQAWKPNYPDYFSGCYVLKKALRSNGEPFGDIIPVSQFRAQVDVAPRLRGAADSRLTRSNVMAYATDYLLNKFWEKELWYALDKSDLCARC
ncbi:hypothetical protein F5878DRAFT_545408 [Lentinula raphanica]|uniref:DUF6830 domain-containing protein n=1 Tax=Lentinula raphanica TaxID=153919 RepID=A0AA38P0R6_9AGAR|nr:hypothetical protein F5878DRAFT_545408 [Lentinula raphanica]